MNRPVDPRVLAHLLAVEQVETATADVYARYVGPLVKGARAEGANALALAMALIDAAARLHVSMKLNAENAGRPDVENALMTMLHTSYPARLRDLETQVQQILKQEQANARTRPENT